MRATILPFSLVAHGTIATIRVLLPTQRAQVQALRGQLNLQRFGAPKFQSELQDRQKTPAWPIHDKARSGWSAFGAILSAARFSSSHCVDSLQFAVRSPSSANCQLRR